MRYFVRVSGLVLLGLLSVGAVVGRSDIAIGQPVEEKKADDRQSSEAGQLIRQGNQQLATSQYEAAQQSYAQLLEIYRKLKDRNGEAGTLNNLGLAYRALSQYDKAIGYYQQALPIFQQVKDRNGEAKALNNLGIAYRSLSQYDKAIVFYKQSINRRESIRYGIRELPQDSQKAYVKSITDTYTYLAKLLTKQGRSTEAQAVLALLDRVPPNNADGIPLTAAEQQILAEFAK
jgi:tetratricopeptide (TPR) repeat protein